MRLFLTIVFLSLSSFSFASREDSLLRILSQSRDTVRVRVLCKLGELTYSSGFDKGRTYALQAVAEAKKYRDLRGESQANRLLGVIYYYKGEFEKALACYLEARGISERSGDKVGTAQVDVELG